MFSMTLSTADSRRSADDARIFYCRTFTFTLHEFLDLVQLLLEAFDGHIPEQLYAWEALTSAINLAIDTDTLIYIRYIGTTNGTAWNRYVNDLTSGSVQGLHRIFYEICQAEFPDVLANAEIEEFDRASIEMILRCARQRLANTREQGLIALFGPSTLLNTAAGGLTAEVVFDATDDREFLNFRTRSIELLENHATDTADLNGLREYGRTVQRYTVNNPISTNSVTYPITNSARDLLVSQANAACVGDYAVLLTIGSDLGPHSFQDMSPFFSGPGRSSALMVSTLQHLLELELGFSTTAQYQISNLQKLNFFPFIDFYPWAKKTQTDLVAATNIARGGLQTTNPVILLTLSEHVASVALGNFHHARGMPRGENIGSICGKVFMVKYDDDPSANNDDCVCLLVPVLHPGGISRAGDNKLYMRLFTKSLSMAWLAMDTAVQVLAEGGTDKRTMCKKIMQILKSKAGPGTPFYQSFEKLRADYRKL